MIKNKMKKIFFIFWIIFFISCIRADVVSITPSYSINPSSTTEGSFFSNNSNPPTLTLINPRNQTYINNNSIPLTYVANGEQAVWYSLDSGTNISLTHPTHFSVSEGSHNLFLYANNSNGETSKNITFFINSIKLKIKDNKWKGTKKGSSTNFSNCSYEELQNLTEIILEDTDYGKIKFNANINITDDEDFSDNEINISGSINLSSNRIEINSSALPNFNKSATLYLYDLPFTTPRILRDGNVCPSTICTGQSYSSATGTLVFNVTSFTVYSAEETPSPGGGGPSGGGGASGGSGGAPSGAVIAPVKSFDVGSEQVKVSITQGSITTKTIIITNKLDKKIALSLSEENLEDFLIIKEKNIELAPKESKEISFDIIVRENVVPDLYFGKLILKDDTGKKEILFMVEVESKGALFDVTVKIPWGFSEVLPNENVMAEISLFNLGEVKRADVEIEYIIKDKEGNEISTSHETVAVETQAGFVREIRLPKDIAEGKYILYIKIDYDNKIASSSAEFSVVKSLSEKIYILLIFFIITVFGLIFYYHHKTRQKGRRIKRLAIHKILRK